jgi:hypothetical protein
MLSVALELRCACTDVMVTKTLLKFPLGVRQLGGSLMLRLAVPIGGFELNCPLPPQLTINKATAITEKKKAK